MYGLLLSAVLLVHVRSGNVTPTVSDVFFACCLETLPLALHGGSTSAITSCTSPPAQHVNPIFPEQKISVNVTGSTEERLTFPLYCFSPIHTGLHYSIIMIKHFTGVKVTTQHDQPDPHPHPPVQNNTSSISSVTDPLQ